MRQQTIHIIWLLVLLTSCKDRTTEETVNFVESQPTFFDLRHKDWLTNKWIRKPSNLIAVHETFKKVGYENLLGTLLSDSPFIIQDLYINKKGSILLDSLIQTRHNRNDCSQYYEDFWARREKEQNDSVVFLILSDIQYSQRYKMSSGILQLHADSTKYNDTLKRLLDIEFGYDTLTPERALNNFETLRRLGFHQSAYNLLFERSEYTDIEWSRDSLSKTLTPSKTNTFPWFPDNSK